MALGFNCAAPFRERLAAKDAGMRIHTRRLQLCRPLSGAVRLANRPPATHRDPDFNCAAPFRERLGLVHGRQRREGAGFNCAAPFRERLVFGGRADTLCQPGFNCAAPFRERLAGDAPPPVAPLLSFNCAAPFRERLVGRPKKGRPHGKRLQLCRPLSGAVSCISRRRTSPSSRFNCAAPFRERLGAWSPAVP